MVLTIGRDKSKNDIHISEPTVSSNHCKITVLDGSFIVEDLESTNHTFINDVPIKISKFYARDKLRLGNYSVDFSWLLSESKKIQLNARIDFRTEFEELKKLYENHKVQLNNIDLKYQKKDIIIRTAVGLVITLVTLNLPIPAYLSAAIGSIALSFIVLFRRSTFKAQKEKEELSVQFTLRYRCPKCGLDFVNKNWKLIEAEKKCVKCKAQFV